MLPAGSSTAASYHAFQPEPPVLAKPRRSTPPDAAPRACSASSLRRSPLAARQCRAATLSSTSFDRALAPLCLRVRARAPADKHTRTSVKAS